MDTSNPGSISKDISALCIEAQCPIFFEASVTKIPGGDSVLKITPIGTWAHVADNVVQLSGHACSVCGAVATRRCSMCKTAFYCGVRCQQLAWQIHKNMC